MHRACSTKSVCGLLALLWHGSAAAQEATRARPQSPVPAPPLTAAAARELASPVLSAPPAATGTGRALTPYLLGGTALLGAGAYALLSSWARDDRAQLARCSPGCPGESVARVRNLYLAADISLGVSAAAALGSIASFVFWGPGANTESAPRRRYALSIQPGRSGALAVFRGVL